MLGWGGEGHHGAEGISDKAKIPGIHRREGVGKQTSVCRADIDVGKRN